MNDFIMGNLGALIGSGLGGILAHQTGYWLGKRHARAKQTAVTYNIHTDPGMKTQRLDLEGAERINVVLTGAETLTCFREYGCNTEPGKVHLHGDDCSMMCACRGTVKT